MSSATLLSARGLEHSYRDRGSQRKIDVLKGVSFDVEEGAALGILGLSGAGKSTICRFLLGLEKPDHGSITFDGAPLSRAGFHQHRSHRGRIQAVFQDPRSSLNPNLSINSIVAEPLLAQRCGDRQFRDRKVREALQAVHLPVEFSNRRPAQLSGGERQRVAIARALVGNAKLVVLDEPVSALDAINRQEVLTLLAGLKERFNLSMILVSHDIRSVNALADHTMVLHEGLIVEEGATAEVLGAPQHPFTRSLIAAAPRGLAPTSA